MPNFKENIPLDKFSSYRIGGPSRYFVEAKNERAVAQSVREAKSEDLRYFVLGGGTNLLIDDDGFDGLVLKPNINFIRQKGDTLHVGAGVLVSDLLNFTIEKGLSGLEWAGGLPGTIGGAVRGNAGAFGGETKDHIGTVQSIDADTLEHRDRNNPQCAFGYRSSYFKEAGRDEIVLDATFHLKKGNPDKIRTAVEEKISYRKERHPMEYPNIGSIFKNVPAERVPRAHRARVKDVIKTDPFPVVPTAYLISEAGLKGVSSGGAMISPKHPNFIANVLHARAADVRALIALIKSEVKKKFGIELEEEVVYVSS